MHCRQVPRRTGRVLAQIVSAVEARGEPLAEDAILVIDFIKNEKDGLVRLVRQTKKGKKNYPLGEWKLGAVIRREPGKDSKCLGGFLECADHLGMSGAMLANLIKSQCPTELSNI